MPSIQNFMKSGAKSAASASGAPSNTAVTAASHSTPVTRPAGAAKSSATISKAVSAAATVSKGKTILGSRNPNEIVVTGKKIKNEDQRLRLKPFPEQISKILGSKGPDNILSPLIDTNGVLFTYTPTIQFSQDVDWKTVEITHSNYDSAAYSRTPSVNLTVSGKFAVETHAEGRYLLAVLHFFRVVSKMHFGSVEANTNMAGMPPPVLLLKGYGDYMFNDLRVVVKSHNYTVDDSVNLVQVETESGRIVTLPSILNLACTLQVIQSPKAQKDQFDLEDFRTGKLMTGGGGWI